jgi:hypothetical protein
MVDPVDYHLLLKYPDRDEPENGASGESRRSGMRTTSRIHSWSAFRPSRRRTDS